MDIGEKHKASYYKFGDKIPSGNYRVINNIYCDLRGIPIAKNSEVVGQSKLYPVNGQHFYAGRSHYHRTKIVRTLKQQYAQAIGKIDPIDPRDYPLKSSVLICKPPRKGWDIDNLWIYHKVIQDVLVDMGIIAGDSVDYICQVTTRYEPHAGERLYYQLKTDTHET